MRKKGVSNCVLFKLIYHFYMTRPTITGTSFKIGFKCVPFPIFIVLFLFFIYFFISQIGVKKMGMQCLLNNFQ